MKKFFLLCFCCSFYACSSVRYSLKIEEDGYLANQQGKFKTIILLQETNSVFDCCGCGPELFLNYTRGNVTRHYGMNLYMDCYDCDKERFWVWETIKKDKYTSINYRKEVVFEKKIIDNLQEKWQSLVIVKDSIKPLDSVDSLMFFQLLPKSRVYKSVQNRCNLGTVIGFKNIDTTITVKKKKTKN